MIEIKHEDIITPELEYGAIYNLEFEGFREDYLVLHCLLKKYYPKRFLEIGCNMGMGTKIIKNAIYDSEVFSLDLPTEQAHKSLQHPISEGKGDKVGSLCNLPFTLLRGDSMTFDYSTLYPIEGWFIDGEHDFDHPNHEAKEAIKSVANIIVFHDANIDCVYNAIIAAFNEVEYYTLYRVVGTRIAYALLKWDYYQQVKAREHFFNLPKSIFK